MKQSVGTSVQHTIEWLLYVAIVVYFGCLFAWNGASKVTLQYWVSTPPQTNDAFIVVLLAFLAGFLSAVAVASLAALRRSMALRTLRNRIGSLESEIVRLRTLPAEPRPRPVPTAVERR